MARAERMQSETPPATNPKTEFEVKIDPVKLKDIVTKELKARGNKAVKARRKDVAKDIFKEKKPEEKDKENPEEDPEDTEDYEEEE